MESVYCSDSLCSDGNPEQIPIPGQLHTGEVVCKCKKPETQEAGTQTPSHLAAEMQDSSTQCTFTEDGTTEVGGINFCNSPVDASMQHPGRRGQCDATVEPDAHPASGEAGSSIKSPWMHQNPRSSCITSTDILNKFPENIDYKVILQRPINPFLNTLSDRKGKVKA